jgi:hypothetical protein
MFAAGRVTEAGWGGDVFVVSVMRGQLSSQLPGYAASAATCASRNSLAVGGIDAAGIGLVDNPGGHVGGRRRNFDRCLQRHAGLLFPASVVPSAQQGRQGRCAGVSIECHGHIPLSWTARNPAKASFHEINHSKILLHNNISSDSEACRYSVANCPSIFARLSIPQSDLFHDYATCS